MLGVSEGHRKGSDFLMTQALWSGEFARRADGATYEGDDAKPDRMTASTARPELLEPCVFDAGLHEHWIAMNGSSSLVQLGGKANFIPGFGALRPLASCRPFTDTRPPRLQIRTALPVARMQVRPAEKDPLGLRELDANVGFKRYAPVAAFFDQATGDDSATVRLADRRAESGPLPGWNTAPVNVAVVLSAYFFYPFLAEILSLLPVFEKVDEFGNANFVTLVSIVFGTLTAATVQQADSRLALLRSVVVDEVTLVLALVKRLAAEISASSECTAEGCAYEQPLLTQCLELLWNHTNVLIAMRRSEELRRLANGQDYLLRMLELLDQPAARGESRDYSSDIKSIEEIIQMRAKRLSLEGAGIPDIQLQAINTISLTVLCVYAVITLDSDMYNLRDLQSAPLSKAFAIQEAFTVRSLFAYLAGAFTLLANLGLDLNQPLQGELAFESETALATLLQARRTMVPLLGFSLDEGLPASNLKKTRL